jgi:hypothetical protein
MTAQVEERPLLSVENGLKTFDSDAQRLVFAMQAAGWRGYMSNRGHAIMHAPDGVTTTSISRDSLRGRSGRNAKAKFTRWVREQAEREQAAHAPGSFGVLPDKPRNMPIPVVTMAEIKKHPEAAAFIRETDGTTSKTIVLDDETPRCWAVFDVRGRFPRLVALGSECTERVAWEGLMAQAPALFPAALRWDQDDREQAKGATVATRYACTFEGCDVSFETETQTRAHYMGHFQSAVPCDFPGCDHVSKNAGGHNLHVGKHDKSEQPCTVAGCDVVSVGKMGMRSHLSRTHGIGKVHTRPVAGDSGDVTVAPPDVTVPEPAPGSNVLLEHLEHLPQGSDAEAMVASIRAIVAGPLVAEMRRLRDELRVAQDDVEKLTIDNGNLEARLALMREALSA